VRRSAFAAQVNAENAVRCRTPIGADISTVGATPLPSTWLMLLSGFAGFGFLAYRGTKKRTAFASA
jgi:hypothetical protein